MTSGTLLQAILLTATKWSLRPLMNRLASVGKTITVPTFGKSSQTVMTTRKHCGIAYRLYAFTEQRTSSNQKRI
jgi:hypothetical protein